MGSKPMVALSLADLPGESGHVILAMGGLDQKIHIYLGDRKGNVSEACLEFSVFLIPFLLKLITDAIFTYSVYLCL